MIKKLLPRLHREDGILVVIIALTFAVIFKEGSYSLVFPDSLFSAQMVVWQIVFTTGLAGAFLLYFGTVICLFRRGTDGTSGIGYRLIVITGACSGAFLFLYIFGPGTLDATNTGWLLEGKDISAHYLGWVFFRNEPWGFPLGDIHGINFPYGTNVVYTDSIPLFAFFFKLIRSLLPGTFQYFGIWTLLCFVMQGVFSALILFELTRNIYSAMIAPFFFCTASILLHRVNYHSALAGQWMLLFSLFLLIRGRRSNRTFHFWPLTFVLSILIHPYLFLMVFGLFLVALMEQLRSGRKWLEIEIWTLINAAVTLITFYGLGLFSSPMFFDAQGYGQFKANLNAFVNPIQQYWSVFIPAQQNTVPSMEGFTYLGFGMILLFFSSLVILFIRNSEKPTVWLKRNGWLLFLCVGLIVYSLSNTVSINSTDLFSYPLPSIFLKLASIFRSSGRFLWPVFYLIFIFAIATPSRRFTPARFVPVLLIVLSLQMMDLSQAIQDRRRLYSRVQVPVPDLVSGFWADAARQVKKVTVLPPDNKDWVKDSLFAARYNLPINHFYYALTDPRVVIDSSEAIASLRQGHFSRDELILLKSMDLVCEISKNQPADSVLARVDGEWVLVSNLIIQMNKYPDIIFRVGALECD